MSQVQTHAFIGRVTQFMPGKRSCFVTLSTPIGMVTRALLHGRTQTKNPNDTLTLSLNDEVCGELILGDAAIAEIVRID